MSIVRHEVMLLLLYENAIRTLEIARVLIRTRSVNKERRVQILSKSMLDMTIGESLESCGDSMHQ
jgi:hypothetical protein